jgi:hypothetical protein
MFGSIFWIEEETYVKAENKEIFRRVSSLAYSSTCRMKET